MPYPDLWGMLGYQTNATMFMEAFRGVSNIVLTDNPSYTVDDFKATFPVFPIVEEWDPETPAIPQEFFNMILAMANASIKYDRYKNAWKYMMGLFMAHFFTLFLQTQTGDPTAENALKGSLPTGVKSSKSVDGLSVSYDFMGVSDDLSGYGTWKLTAYGQQLATLSKLYGIGGMWVNG